MWQQRPSLNVNESHVRRWLGRAKVPCYGRDLLRIVVATSFCDAGFCRRRRRSFTLSERAYGSLAVPSPFWLPDSVLLCALLIAPRREWWFFLLAIWPIRLLAGAVPGTPVWFQFASVANDTAKAFAAAWLIQRATRRTPFWFPSTQHTRWHCCICPGRSWCWAAVRLRPFGAANAVSLVAVVSIVAAARGTGIFAAGPSVLTLQFFLLVLGISLLTLAVVIDERLVLMARERKFNRLLSRAQDDERARIARELHDDFTQQLALLKRDRFRSAPSSTSRCHCGGNAIPTRSSRERRYTGVCE